MIRGNFDINSSEPSFEKRGLSDLQWYLLNLFYVKIDHFKIPNHDFFWIFMHQRQIRNCRNSTLNSLQNEGHLKLILPSHYCEESINSKHKNVFKGKFYFL